ncbi:uncharacterized protein C8R40DRAFT_1067329 [Lentinula edodes]|uniref:uncharacterized protein n=1 Tax=Lentinula edodes TaxID=5353 RepID=UPI001E8D78FB|nr:uncharacterized protein C8R40DRAFT_1067329 [Lentinula edodes]KAH7878302.1 hypothetical protein C8R40DRAFT_1067329 [Lentinula edodes]
MATNQDEAITARGGRKLSTRVRDCRGNCIAVCNLELLVQLIYDSTAATCLPKSPKSFIHDCACRHENPTMVLIFDWGRRWEERIRVPKSTKTNQLPGNKQRTRDYVRTTTDCLPTRVLRSLSFRFILRLSTSAKGGALQRMRKVHAFDAKFVRCSNIIAQDVSFLVDFSAVITYGRGEGLVPQRRIQPTPNVQPELLRSSIVLLLRPLYQLNTLEAESTPLGGEKRNLLEKLSAKLTRQLEETIIIPASHHKDESYLVTLPVLNKIALSKEALQQFFTSVTSNSTCMAGES